MHSNDDKREWIDPAQGLSDSQVQERIDAGCVNTQDERITKSYEEIFRDNVLTLFNLINAILAGLIIFIGSFKNLLFLGVVISNLVIRYPSGDSSQACIGQAVFDYAALFEGIAQRKRNGTAYG